MRKRELTLIFIVLAAILMAIFSLIIFNYLKDSDKVRKIVIQEANKKINGSVEIGKLKWCFEDKHLGLSTNLLKITDLKGKVFAQAEDLSIIFKWNSLFKGLDGLLKLKSKSLDLNICKDSDKQWNFKKILKKQKKGKKFLINNLNVNKVHLNIEDKIKESILDYPDLSISWRKQNTKGSFFVDINTHKNLEIENTEVKNYIRINGTLNTAPIRKSYKQNFDLNINLKNLDLDKIPNINALGQLSLQGKLFNTNKRLNLQLNGFLDKLCLPEDDASANNKLSDVHIDTDISFTKRHMIIRNININWEDLMVYLSGKILKWRNKNPKFDINIITEKLNLKEVYETVPSKLIPENLKRLMLEGNYDGAIQSDLNIRGRKNSPIIDGYLNIVDLHSNYAPQSNIAKNVFIDFMSQESKLLIQKLSILFKLSSIQANGSLDLKDKTFNLDFQGDDLDLKEIQNSLLKIPHFKINSNLGYELFLKGNSALKGNISKESKDTDLKINSNIFLKDVDIFSKKYSLNYQNISGEIKIEDKLINLNQIYGKIDNGLLTANGSIKLTDSNKLSSADIKLDGRNLNVSSFTNPRTLRLLNINNPPHKAFGGLSKIELDIKHKDKETNINGLVNLKDISFQRNPGTPLLSNIDGQILLNDYYWKIKGLEFKFNNSPISIKGICPNLLRKPNKQKTNPDDFTDLDIKISNAKVSDIIYIADLYSKTKPIPKPTDASGWVALEANLKGKSLSGLINLEKVSLNYPSLKYPSSNINGQAKLSETIIDIQSLTGNYGNSLFEIKGNIENFFDSSEILWNLDIEGKLNAQEIMAIMPEKVNNMIRASGTLPLKATLNGSKFKNVFNFEALINELDLFSFSTWLKIDRNFLTTLKGKLLITPGSVVSDDTRLEIIEIQSSKEIKPFSVVKSNFQVKNIKTPELRFQVDIASADKNTRLRLLRPHIKVLDPINLQPKRGHFECSVSGTRGDHQTLCEIYGKRATLEKFGIGDLNGENININLLAMTDKPVLSHITSSNGDWDKVPFTKLDLYLENTARTVEVKNLTANIKDGKALANLDLNLKTQKSNFNIEGDTLPAHEFANALWKLGDEIPEGTFNIEFSGSTEGMDEESIFNNLVGKANVVAKNGKLSDLVSMQKILSALNTFKEGLISFDLNNVMNTLVSYKGGQFDYIISSLNYDHGKVSTDKLLLKSHQMDIIAKGELDFPNDSLTASGKGGIVRHASSVLTKVGVGKFNLGNAASILSPNTAKEKVLPSDSKHRFFEFKMTGKISDQDETAKSLKNNFEWL